MAPKKKKPPVVLGRPTINEINFSFQKVVSYSQFSTYLDCPHKWYLTSVEKKSGPPNIHMVFGTAIHFTLQHYLQQMFETSGAAADRLDLVDIFENKYIDEYQKQYKDNKEQHFSNPTEMREFHDDGVEIINWFKKNRNKYFKSRGCWLMGIEMPLQIEVKKNVIFVGYLDLVIYDEELDKLYIIDFKTSTRGWNEYAKKDDKKLAQLLLYKKYFSELYSFPIEKIEVEFMVLKRKVEPNEFQQFPKRVQTIKPAAGKIKINQASETFKSFIQDAFDEDGKPIRKVYAKNITKLCDYCIFNNTADCKKDEK